jgi:hypothetical protein
MPLLRPTFIGPIFFDLTLNTEVYVIILNAFMKEMTDESLPTGYFQ